MNWIKERWEWFLGGIILLIGIFSSTKTKNDVKEKDAKARLEALKELQNKQRKLTEDYIEEKKEISKKRNDVATKVEVKIEKEKEKIKKDKSLIDKHLKDAGLKKK